MAGLMCIGVVAIRSPLGGVTPRPAADDVRAGRRGFLLVELLVAFVVAALALGGLMLIFSTGLHGLGAADASRRATLWAQSKLETIGVSEPLADSGGSLGEGLRWTATVAPYPDDAAGSSGSDALPPVRLFHVVVTMSWSNAGRPQSVSLGTLRLARR